MKDVQRNKGDMFIVQKIAVEENSLLLMDITFTWLNHVISIKSNCTFTEISLFHYSPTKNLLKLWVFFLENTLNAHTRFLQIISPYNIEFYVWTPHYLLILKITFKSYTDCVFLFFSIAVLSMPEKDGKCILILNLRYTCIHF